VLFLLGYKRAELLDVVLAYPRREGFYVHCITIAQDRSHAAKPDNLRGEFGSDLAHMIALTQQPPASDFNGLSTA
jgi:hypothetical protein